MSLQVTNFTKLMMQQALQENNTETKGHRERQTDRDRDRVLQVLFTLPAFCQVSREERSALERFLFSAPFTPVQRKMQRPWKFCTHEFCTPEIKKNKIYDIFITLWPQKRQT
jgi:hypothetical protein